MSVITSYSIHYTKLYDVDITITDGGTPIIINSNDPGVSVSGSTLKIDLSPYLPLTANTNYIILIDGSSIRDNAGNVITSYSIHYTKLYEYLLSFITKD